MAAAVCRRQMDASLAISDDVRWVGIEADFQEADDPAGRHLVEHQPELVVTGYCVAQLPGSPEVVPVERAQPSRFDRQPFDEGCQLIRVSVRERAEDDLRTVIQAHTPRSESSATAVKVSIPSDPPRTSPLKLPYVVLRDRASPSYGWPTQGRRVWLSIFCRLW
ncbi:hypothetical protein ACFYO0_46260, partial [Streptomyces sp. NPDC006365]|uniref:hypothetical protein n=1 Tax=Streptomyces sp. NPDC006365 TaxID=3364744 RepID=UPI00369C7BBE